MSKSHDKRLEQFWLKYRGMEDLDIRFPPSREQFFSFFDSAYQVWFKTGNTSAQIEADLQHHVEMQKIFIKWRMVHGKRI